MIYTILTAQDLATGQKLDLEKVGNTYKVLFTNKEILYKKTFKIS